MFEFMFTDYRGSDLWHLDPTQRGGARKSGLLFSADELREIWDIWGALCQGAALHTKNALFIPARAGGYVEVTPASLRLDDHPAPEAMRAAMAHIAANWGGRASIRMNSTTDREARLTARAYAEVYGVELDDDNEGFAPLALTRDELARLPVIRQQIRAHHQDAPPERPDEAQRLPAMYARRYPFRAAVAA